MAPTPGRSAASRPPIISDPVEVYCRLRPQFGDNKENQGEDGDEVIAGAVVVDDTTLKLIPPSTRLGVVKEVECVFTHVFPESAAQRDIFDRSTVSLVDDLVHGRNGLLFTYGITGSGKTYTMTGNPKEIGLLPRCLDVIFNSIGELTSGKYVFQPDGYNGFTVQTEAMAEIDRCTRDALTIQPTASSSANTQSAPASARRGRKRAGSDDDEDAVWQLKPRNVDSSRVHLIDEDSAYSVFVSYIEIYNNYIFDLLDTNIDPKKGPQSKGLREDCSKNMYVTGVTEVEVKTTDEAFEVFAKGQKLRRVAHTALNAESSRSHSVFNIRLVQAPLDADGREPIQDKSKIHVSQLALVDLAGSERCSRTGHTGERMKEAGKINTSLMTLRQCMEQLRENQKNGLDKMVPYRDSRLTHLFKNYFDGEGKVHMVVCMNPAAADYDENLHVIQFAEMTQEVEVVRGAGAAQPDNDDDERGDGLAVGRRRAAQFYQEFHEHAVGEGTSSPHRQNQPAFSCTPKTTLSNGFYTMMPSVEVQGPTDEDAVASLRRFFEDRLRKRNVFESETLKKQSELESGFGRFLFEAETVSARYAETRRELELMREEQRRHTTKNKTLQTQLTTVNQRLQRYELDARNMANQQEQAFRRKERDMEAKVQQKDQKIRKVREIFEARTTTTTTTATLNPRVRVLGASQPDINKPSPQTKPTPRTDYTQKSDSGGCATTTSLYPSVSSRARPATRPLTPGNALRGRTATRAHSPPAVAAKPSHLNTKYHRRSKSSGGVVLDHQPMNKIPPGQLLQANLAGLRKVTTDSPDKYDLRMATDYLLTHQETEARTGTLKTSLVKGDVFPTAGGGRSVIFTDVEQATHRAPGKRASDEESSTSSSAKKRK